MRYTDEDVQERGEELAALDEEEFEMVLGRHQGVRIEEDEVLCSDKLTGN